MRDAPLTVLKGGINRLRTKGGARADSLYDLLNGYLTDDGTVHVRPGSLRVATLDSTTRGLTYFSGSRHTFAAAVVSVPTGYTLHVLVHPEQDPGEAVIPIKTIHFAEPMMGYLYVVEEFEDDSVWHYWLQGSGAWTANTVYREGDIIFPTVPNGIAYQATRSGPPNPVWTANTPRDVGDIVEPTADNANGYYYTVVDTSGATPSSGSTEPTWPAEDGAQVVESTDITPAAADTDAIDPDSTPGSDVTDRYGDPSRGFLVDGL
jgi:hypothetical protein